MLLIRVFTAIHSPAAAALILPFAMLLIIGCAMVLPVLTPPLVWLLTAPLAAPSGAISLWRGGARWPRLGGPRPPHRRSGAL